MRSYRAHPQSALQSSLQSTTLPLPSRFHPQTTRLQPAPTDSRTQIGHSFINLALTAPDRPAVQPAPQLRIGATPDRAEQAADRVAAQVVQQLHRPSPVPLDQAATPPLRALTLQRWATAASTPVHSPDLASRIQAARGQGAVLPSQFRQRVEPMLGANLQAVRLHTDATADRMNQAVRAKAFTVGRDIFFRQGEYHPHSRQGQTLLAHELTHVVQQTGGQAAKSPAPPVIQRYVQQASEQSFATQSLKAETQDNISLDYVVTSTQTGLKVSDDGEMAVPNAKQPKELFASAAVIKASNLRLEAVDSVIRLVPTGATQAILHPDTDAPLTLQKVVPTNLKDPVKSVFYDAANLQQNCNIMAGLVMGKANLAEAKGEKVTPATVGQPETATPLNYNAMVESQAAVPPPEPDAPDGGGGPAPTPLGENETAAPQVGESFATFSSGKMDPGKHWNWHFAGVVARSGADAVTLENYTRGGEYQKELTRVVEAIANTKEALANRILQVFKSLGMDAADLGGVDPQSIESLANLLAVVQGLSAEDANKVRSNLLYAVQEVNQTLVDLDKISRQNITKIAGALWYFQMYGAPQKQHQDGQIEDQSYHAEMVKSGDFSEPQTLRVRNQEAPTSQTTTQGFDPEVQRILNQIGAPVTPASWATRLFGQGKKANRLKLAASGLVRSDEVAETDLQALEQQIPLIGDSADAREAQHALAILRLDVAIGKKTAELHARMQEIGRLPELAQVSDRSRQKILLLKAAQPTLLTAFQTEVDNYQRVLEHLLSSEHLFKLPGASVAKVQMSAVQMRLQFRHFAKAWQAL
jgi:Domain of unknown function (DUF4157)